MSLSGNFFGEGNRRGILSMTAAMLLFVANDALVKLISARIPLGQVMVVRGIMVLLVVFCLIWANGHLRYLRSIFRPVILLRGVSDLLASVTYLLALLHMPIGNLTAINMGTPLVMTAFAAIFAHEQVGWRRWAAVIVGFGGILMIVQPRADAFNSWSLVALASMLFVVTRDLSTRNIDRAIPSLVVVFAASVIVTAGAAGMIPFQGWVPLLPGDYIQLAAAALFLLSGYKLVTDSMRHGELSLVAPFRYSALVWALAAGLMVWGELPNLLAFAGIGVVVCSGLYVLHRERVRRLQAAADADGLKQS